VPGFTAEAATTETPKLFEVATSGDDMTGSVDVYYANEVQILSPSADLIFSPTFSSASPHAFVVSMPPTSARTVPNDLVEVINGLKEPVTYLYFSPAGPRIAVVFQVDRQTSYENLFKKTSRDLMFYDVVAYSGMQDIHEASGPVVLLAGMDARVAIPGSKLCGPVPGEPTTTTTTVPTPELMPVRGCHSDYTNETYITGEEWSEGDCQHCTCVNGDSLCYHMDCFMMDCKHRVKVPGQCCDKCLDVAPPEPEPEFGPWSPWGKCYFRFGNNHCGKGYQYRERKFIGPVDIYEPSEDEIYEERTCFEACKDENDEIEPSMCPEATICDHREPVCGSAAPGPAQTWDSMCHLAVAACKHGQKPVKLYSGECKPGDDTPANALCERDGPVATTVKYESKDEMEECVGPVTDVKTCASLLCKGGAGTCCKPTGFTAIEVTVSCYSPDPRAFLRHKKHVHYSATGCSCADKP